MKTRIKEMRKELGMTQNEFAKALEVSDRAVKSWESGEKIPPTVRLEQISTKFGYCMEWIKDGIEPKRTELELSSTQVLLEALERDRGKPFPSMVKAIAEIYAEADEVDRQALNQLVDEILEKMQK